MKRKIDFDITTQPVRTVTYYMSYDEYRELLLAGGTQESPETEYLKGIFWAWNIALLLALPTTCAVTQYNKINFGVFAAALSVSAALGYIIHKKVRTLSHQKIANLLDLDLKEDEIFIQGIREELQLGNITLDPDNDNSIEFCFEDDEENWIDQDTVEQYNKTSRPEGDTTDKFVFKFMSKEQLAEIDAPEVLSRKEYPSQRPPSLRPD